MKRTFLLCIIVSLFISSCRKDDDDNYNGTINPELFVASWSPTSAKIISGADGSTIGPLEIPICRNLFVYVFEFNGNFTLKKYGKNSEDECVRQEDWDDHGTYIFDSETNVLTAEDDEGILLKDEVYKLTSSEMQLRMEVGDQNNDGVNDFYLTILNKVN